MEGCVYPIHLFVFGELTPSFSVEPMNLFFIMSGGEWSCYELGL